MAKSNVTVASDIKDVCEYINAVDAISSIKATAALKRRFETDDWKDVAGAIKSHFLFLSMSKVKKDYTPERAAACIFTLANSESKKGDDDKRTALEDAHEATARSQLRHLLGRLGIKSKDAMSGNQNAKRTPTPKVETAPAAPISLAALTVPVTKNVNDLDTVFALLSAWTGKVLSANSANFTGDKGAGYRDMVAHIQSEVKRIASLAE